MALKKVLVRPSRKNALVVGNSTYYSIHDFELSPEDKEIAYREINEREDERENCIQKLRRKLEDDSEHRYYTDDVYLLSILRFRKFDLNKAYKTVRKAHSIRRENLEMFEYPDKMKNILDSGAVSCLPYRDEEGRCIFTFCAEKINLAEMSVQNILQVGGAVFTLVTMNPHCQINGVVGIWDFKGLTLRHVTPLMSASMIWTLSNMYQDCFPERIKLILFLNCQSVFHLFYNGAKMFLKKKISDRVKMLADISELHQYVNPALLPKRWGGMLADDQCNITGHVLDNLPYLEYLQSFRTVSDSPLD